MSSLFIFRFFIFLTSISNSFKLSLSSKFSVYLLGDSVSERLYVDGLIKVFNCSSIDPNIIRSVETITDYYPNNKGLLCNDKNITRIGYMFHWGIAKKEVISVNQFLSHQHRGTIILVGVNIEHLVMFLFYYFKIIKNNIPLR